VEGTPEHVTALHLATGERIGADFFIDASGFRGEIAGRHQGTPWRDFSDALFCDRALISGWERCEDEPILPYTTVETMASGWCWRIEHEHYINRGYVHSSRFIDEETALAEYRRLNPRATAEPRTVRFRTGCLERAWTGNVVAVGNAAGFVEPLEATALQLLAVQCANLVSCLELCDGQPNDSVRALHNRTHTLKWEAVRDFLALHYAFNTRLDTPFWRHCRAETPLGGAAEFVAFFRENGPAPDTAQLLLDPVNPFGAEGYLALLIGQNVPVARQFRFSPQDDVAWRQQQQRWKDQATRAMTVAEGLAALRAAGNRWAYAPDARHAV
jgi:tryptophan halogenase